MWQKNSIMLFKIWRFFFEGKRNILSSFFAFWHKKDAGSYIANNP
jgi:hypothetical protein